MEPLKTNIRVLTWFCIYPAGKGKGTGNRIKLSHYTFMVFVLVFNVISIAVSINTFMETNAEDAVYTIVPLSAEINCIYIFVAALVSRHKITALMNDLVEICKKCKINPINFKAIQSIKSLIQSYLDANNDAAQYLNQANNISELMWMVFLKFFICGSFIGSILLALLSVLFSIMVNGEIVSNYLYRPFKTM